MAAPTKNRFVLPVGGLMALAVVARMLNSRNGQADRKARLDELLRQPEFAATRPATAPDDRTTGQLTWRLGKTSPGPTPARRGPAARAADVNASFDVPVLTVGPSGDGECQRLPFSLVRGRADRMPLAVALAEDTPGGTGASLRASVWVAAMVAALDRLDDLSGARVAIRLPGRVDGPSAGGAVCLAILSALDGRAFPADCAVTGTVMPDGTIGGVGGIAAKLRAAAAAGVKRVLVPADLRFERDGRTGADVDLRRLAQSQNVELLPVENVCRAYKALHGLAARPEALPDLAAATDLAMETEEHLKAAYRADLDAGGQLLEAIPREEQARIAADPILGPVLVGTREKAERAYRAGRLLYATENIASWRRWLEARRKSVAVMATLAGTDLAADLAKADDALGNLVRSMPDPGSTIAAAARALPDTGIQFCAGVHDAQGLIGLVLAFQGHVDEGVAELAKAEDKDPEQQAELTRKILTVKAAQLLFAHYAAEVQGRVVADATALARTLPARAVTGDVAGVGRLFFSAHLAAQDAFSTDVVGTAVAAMRIDPGHALAGIAKQDAELTMYLPVARSLRSLRDAPPGAGGEPQARFTLAVAAHADAGALATVGGLSLRWGGLETDLDPATGAIRYGRPDLLNRLLTAARANALANLAQCRARRVACVLPIAEFEAAELGRDDPEEDKVTVLSRYWNASLQAKVLLMLFAEP